MEKVIELTQNNSISATTIEIVEQTGISRANVSHYLNILVNEGLIYKTNTRPVQYHTNKKELIGNVEKNTTEYLKSNIPDPFYYLLGYNSSLKKQISQAKAAVIYPPKGLHTLLTGDTGVGKSLFATLMYKYAVFMNRLADNAPFIVFNCADYASNPQLLVSHIFGHAKGAFTGADKDKAGLISEANGGMLFLDEVHRLPPEGQEMIFYFMDTGTYGFLGETKRHRESEILLVCATTEEPSSALLSTFLRRIPITIHLPNLAQRTPEDQIELVKFLVEIESKRINCAVSLDPESVKAIVGSSFTGNIGKLKSTIQSVCAQFFIDKSAHENHINVNFEALELTTKMGVFNLERDNDYQSKIKRAIGDGIHVSPDSPHYQLSNDSYIDLTKHDTPFKVYEFIDNRMNFILDQKFDIQQVNRYITSELNNFLSFNIQNSKDNFDHGIDSKILNFCYSLQAEITLQLGKELGNGFVYLFGYHLQNIIDNPQTYRVNTWTRRYAIDKFKEYGSAQTIKTRLQSDFNVSINDDEVAYLTILLSSLVVHERGKVIHIIVATHGEKIASNMADIAKKLIGEQNITAVDMPLDIRPNQAIDKIKGTIISTENAKGFLLLVDMGSLLQAGEIIEQEYNIPVKTLDMVSTPLVIEALRRTVILNADLNEIYFSLQHFKGYGANKPDYLALTEKPLAILAICSTGKGIAKKLQDLLRSILDEMNRKDIHIVNISVDEVLSEKHSLLTDYQVLLSVGVIDPQLDAPYIPLAHLFTPAGELTFQNVIGRSFTTGKSDENPVTVTKLSEQYLQDFLVFLNPKKIVPIIMSFIRKIREERELDDFGKDLLKNCVHICLALERSIRHESIEYNKNNKQKLMDSQLFKIYQHANYLLEEKIGAKLSDDELFYIIDMIESE
ncbi:sigma-54 factor, interaction domain-containing protein [Providencia burhodogranariea DSM 19968]|uniref:Sigma-54 factor, interaction domain-containing protein n=1 Tax=Providencia burhodogranariea DSM 19968 TaxID=1141662 RepID=K8WMK4_9GAMM|nr:sigma-54 factor, interaction domain-containing protein [Providencia burhodogranariea DSM 19968]